MDLGRFPSPEKMTSFNVNCIFEVTPGSRQSWCNSTYIFIDLFDVVCVTNDHVYTIHTMETRVLFGRFFHCMWLGSLGSPHEASSQEIILPLLTHTAAAPWHILTQGPFSSHSCQSPSVIPYFHVGNAHGRIFLMQPLCYQQSMPDHRRCISTWNLYDKAVKFVWFCPCFTHVWWVFHNILTKHALGRGFGPGWEWAMALFRKCGQGWKTLIQGYILIPT